MTRFGYTLMTVLVHRIQRAAHAITQEGQALHRLIAENEPNMTVRDFTAPAAHGSGGYLLPQQTIGDIDTVQTKRRHIQKQSPGAGGPNDWKVLKLFHGLIPTSLVFSVSPG